jgi:DNA-binding transcriptional ArsR family regulator
VNSSGQLDRGFVALAHPARRAIVARLAQGPATVGEATRELTLSKPAISKHLKVLEESGLLRRRIEGRTHRLLLDPRPLDEATRWIEHHRALWETKLDAVEEWLSSD